MKKTNFLKLVCCCMMCAVILSGCGSGYGIENERKLPENQKTGESESLGNEKINETETEAEDFQKEIMTEPEAAEPETTEPETIEADWSSYFDGNHASGIFGKS